MNEVYEQELQEEINFLLQELAYLQKRIEAARSCGDTDEYTRLMRVCLPVQKQYLKLCAEQEKREMLADDTDPLTAFNA
ncbi:MAG: hypothetical protein SPI01_01270 [Succiniclasticum sp.]|nr:hypothetical protein [Succiniclasticum sp.]